MRWMASFQKMFLTPSGLGEAGGAVAVQMRWAPGEWEEVAWRSGQWEEEEE